MRSLRTLALAAASAALLALSACGTSAPGGTDTTAGSDTGGTGASGEVTYPVEIEHALGTTVIEEKPERVATVNWANHEVPLALGVVPVGMAAANYADEDGDGLLPWTKAKLDELGAETPVLFDDTAGIDFEAVANTEPDVILAAYSGMTQEDYDTLSQIAPTVAYPENAWGSTWQETIEFNSAAMGMAPEGQALLEDLTGTIEGLAGEHPELEGKTAMFMTHMNADDLSQVGFYTQLDTRVKFFRDLGLEMPESVVNAADGEFSQTLSAEQADQFSDVDIIVAYGDAALQEQIQADPLLSKIPAIANGAIVWLDGTTAASTAANPTPLAIDDPITADYVEQLGQAAAKAS